MKTEKVLGVVVMILIGLFICITVDFSMILASTISRAKIANMLILNNKQETNKLNGIENGENYSESIKDQNIDFVNLSTNNIGNEDFTPNLYRWLWEKRSSE